MSYYPRTYDVYEKPQDFADLEPDRVQAVTAMLHPDAGGKEERAGIILPTAVLTENGIRLRLCPGLICRICATACCRGGIYIFRGRVQKKKERLSMDQPEI